MSDAANNKSRISRLRKLDISDALVATPLLEPSDFFQELLGLLLLKLRLRAISFYSVEVSGSYLVLRSQRGFNYADYESFELTLESLAGRAFVERQRIVLNEITGAALFRDQKLATNAQISCGVAVPLVLPAAFFSVQPAGGVVGVICAYPENREDLDAVATFLDKKGPYLATQYAWAIKNHLLKLRDVVVDQTASSSDLNSALHRTLIAILPLIEVEAASVFLYDDKTKLLRLHASTGIQGAHHFQRHDIFYSEDDKDAYTWKAFSSEQPVILSDLKGRQGKHSETTQHPVHSLYVCPIARSSSPASNRIKVSGAIRIINKRLSHGEKTEVTGFSWEDTILINYLSDLVTAITHMFRSREARFAFFERVMHGSGSSILACLQNIDSIKRWAESLDDKPTYIKYAISNTQDFLTDIDNQMERLIAPTKKVIELHDFKITGTVLAKTVSLFEKMTEAEEIPSATITNLRDSSFFSIPKVYANSTELMTVFRNLIENAIKYRIIGSGRCAVHLSHNVDSRFVYIRVRDEGIGIPDRAKARLFTEGFRAENAIRLQPAGTGLGLAQAKHLMLLMNGDISLESSSPTTFVVKIQRYLK